MKYLILIYSNPSSRAIWEGMTDAERAGRLSSYAALTTDLATRGELIVAEALADASQTTCVTVRHGAPVTTGGPLAPAEKEQLTGVFLIDCDTKQRAIDIAARLPEVADSNVEVRPIRNPDDW